MRQILPTAVDDVDPLSLYLADPRPAHTDRPWVMLNMVTTVDGATAFDGVSGGLGGEGDRIVFGAVRASCDWIVAAAGTVRAERYGLPRGTEEAAAARTAAGREALPRLAVVTGSLDLDPDLPLFRGGDDRPPPVVLTGHSAPPERIDELAEAAEVVVLDSPRPTPRLILDALAARGAEVVLVEGGPTFNGQLHDADVIDELCLTVSPQIVGGSSLRAVAGGAPRLTEFRIDRILEDEATLFLRYVRDR